MMIEKRMLYKSQPKQLKLDNADDRKVTVTDRQIQYALVITSTSIAVVNDVSVSHVPLWTFNWVGLLDDIVTRFDAAEPVFPSSIGEHKINKAGTPALIGK
jgi:hypothetical protein